MKVSNLLLAVLPLFRNAVEAHYSFATVLVDGVASEKWKYIRKLKNWEVSMPYYHYDTNNPNIRCNNLEKTSWEDTSTLKVVAGDTVSFGIYTSSYRTIFLIYHPGPGRAYLSRAPGDNLATYAGDGDWFKIGEYGVLNRNTWVLQGTDTWMNFTIPKTTPPGKYLLRVEHMYPLHPGFNRTQFYHSCAHVDIVGDGGGTPGPLFKLPQGYDPYHPGIAFPGEVADTAPEQIKNYLIYQHPGPAVWKG